MGCPQPSLADQLPGWLLRAIGGAPRLAYDLDQPVFRSATKPTAPAIDDLVEPSRAISRTCARQHNSKARLLIATQRRQHIDTVVTIIPERTPIEYVCHAMRAVDAARPVPCASTAIDAARREAAEIAEQRTIKRRLRRGYAARSAVARGNRTS
jgi:hypothetical protein